MFLISPSGFPGSLYTSILNLGLTSGLKLCLDAGDSESYDGSSQTWVDRSGNGNSFYRGSGSGSESSDPAFSGISGGQSASEYFGFDGGDHFQETAGHTFADDWHKNNAAFTIVAQIYAAAAVGGLAQVIFSDDTFVAASGGGIEFYQNGANGLNFNVTNDSGSILTIVKNSPALNIGGWNFVAVSLDEAIGANGAILQINSSQSLATSTYTSPSSSAPDNPLRIGRSNDDNRPLLTGARVAGVQAWSRALSAVDLTAFYAALQPKFGF